MVSLESVDINFDILTGDVQSFNDFKNCSILFGKAP